MIMNALCDEFSIQELPAFLSVSQGEEGRIWIEPIEDPTKTSIDFSGALST